MRKLALLLLLACDKKSPAPRPPPPRVEAAEADLRKVLAEATTGPAIRALFPTRDSLLAILTGEEGERLATLESDIWDANRAKKDEELVEAWSHLQSVEVLPITTEELREDPRFTVTHGRVAKKALKPGQAVWIVRPGGARAWEGQMMFAHDGKRWFYAGQLFRYVK